MRVEAPLDEVNRLLAVDRHLTLEPQLLEEALQGKEVERVVVDDQYRRFAIIVVQCYELPHLHDVDLRRKHLLPI